MNDELCERIQSVLPEIVKTHNDLFKEFNKHEDWYENRQYFLKENSRYLEILIKELKKSTINLMTKMNVSICKNFIYFIQMKSLQKFVVYLMNI